MKLEEIARKSSDAARASVVRLDPPPIGERAERPVWRSPALLGAAAIVLIVGAGLLLANRGTGDQNDEANVATREADVPRLGIEPPAGWSVDGAADLDDTTRWSGPDTYFSYYGRAGASDVFADGDVVTVVIELAEGDTNGVSLDGEATVTVRGVDAVFLDGPETGVSPEVRLIQWIERDGDDGALLMIGSRSLDDDALIDLAERSEVQLGLGSRSLQPPADLGLDRLSSDTASPLQIGSAGDGYLIGYSSSGEEGQVLVNTRAGDLERAAIAYRWWSSDVTEVSVGGGPALLADFSSEFGEDSSASWHSVVWSPTPGVVASLVAFGELGDLDIVQLAESASIIDEETWTIYENLTDQQDGTTVDQSAYDEVYGDGGGEIDGVVYTWVVGIQTQTGTEELCFDFGTGSTGSGSCQPAEQMVRPVAAMGNTGGVGYALVALDPGVELAEAEGIGVITPFIADGEAWFVYVGPPDHDPLFVTTIDGDPSGEFPVDLAADEETLREPAFEEGPGPGGGFAMDIADNPSAQALGIVDDFVLLLAGGDDVAPWVMGTVGDELCLVTGGEAVSAGCLPGPIGVLQPLDLPDGTLLTFVIAEVPVCLDIDGVAAGSIESAQGFSEGHGTHAVEVVDGAADGWTLDAFDQQGNAVSVPLPDIGGSTEWPADVCATS